MQIRCKLIAFAQAAIALSAARGGVPTEWQVRIGPKATVYQAERYHGDALDLRATLTSGGLPLVYQGAARLYAQTNGMGALWWDLAPVTVASNVLAATWRPEFDTGADVVDVFLGAPSNFQAHARIRFLPSPGPAPNSLPMPTPVLDFSAVDLVNVAALTNGWSFGDPGGPYPAITDGTNIVTAAREVFGVVQTNRFSDWTWTSEPESGVIISNIRWEPRAALPGVYDLVFDARTDAGTGGTGYVVSDLEYITTIRYVSDFSDPDARSWEITFRRSVVPVTETNHVGRLALTNDIEAAMNDSISTNNAAFVSAVLAVPLTGADASDLAELSEYGSYGTVGAAILALIAGLAALKRRVTSAETALVQKASFADLPYAMVTPGEWTFSDGWIHDISGPFENNDGRWYYTSGVYLSNVFNSESEAVVALTLTFTDPSGESDPFAATRASLPGHLLDRAVNTVPVTGDTTLTLPALVNAGKARDFLVRLAVSGSTVPTITFAAPTGETITYETDGNEFPVPDEAGTWLYSFTETAAHTFAVALKKVNAVAQVAQGGT